MFATGLEVVNTSNDERNQIVIVVEIIRIARFCSDSSASCWPTVRLECQTGQAYSSTGRTTVLQKHSKLSMDTPERLSCFKK